MCKRPQQAKKGTTEKRAGNVLILLATLLNKNKSYMELLNKLTGRKYWYSVKFIYKTKQNKILFDFTLDVGVNSRKYILKSRYIKCLHKPMHKLKAVKGILCNGYLSTETICYLGWF